MRFRKVALGLLLVGCGSSAPLRPAVDAGPDAGPASDTGPDAGGAVTKGECRGPGRYEAGKEGSYRPCCPGLAQVPYPSKGYTGVEAATIPACSFPPLNVYACVKGFCGDGICEAGEAPACGCVDDCPEAAWGTQAPRTPGTTYGQKMGGTLRLDGRDVRVQGTAAAVVRDGLAQLFMIPDSATEGALARATVSIAFPAAAWKPGTITGTTLAIGGTLAIAAPGGSLYRLDLPVDDPARFELRIDRAVPSDDGSHVYLTGRLKGSLLPATGAGAPLAVDFAIGDSAP